MIKWIITIKQSDDGIGLYIQINECDIYYNILIGIGLYISNKWM